MLERAENAEKSGLLRNDAGYVVAKLQVYIPSFNLFCTLPSYFEPLRAEQFR